MHVRGGVHDGLCAVSLGVAMPKARINGIDLYFETHGQGEPVLMIKGLGHSSKFWFFQIPEFEKRFKSIIYDNRGVGNSDKPKEPYTIADEALDAIGLLDLLGVERAHVIGCSRGGYIAQELAINHSSRVDKLVLLVTHAGGPEYLDVTGEIWADLLDVAGLSMEEIFRKGVKYLTTEEFFRSRPDLVDRMVAMRMENPQPAHSFKLQFDSAVAFNATDRVGRIEAPTLVVAGRHDRVVPLELCEKLARSIPGAELKVVENASHMVFIEQPEEVNRAIVDFLRER